MNKIIKSKIMPKWLLLVVTIFLSLVIVFAGVMLLYELNYKNKIYKGVKIGDVSLGGKTKVQAKIDKLSDEGVEFHYLGNKKVIEPVISAGADTGLAYELWQFSSEEIVEELYEMGRSGNIWKDFGSRIKLLLVGSSGRVDYQLNEKETADELVKFFKEFESPGRDADLVWKNNKFEISLEETGFEFEYINAIEKLNINLAYLRNDSIGIDLVIDEPKITKNEVEFLTGPAMEILKSAPVTLSFKKPEYYQGRKIFEYFEWYLSEEQLKEWLTIKNDQEVYIGIDSELALELLGSIAESIDTPAKDAKFEVKDGRVSEWQSSTDGFTLNKEESISRIEEMLVSEKNNKIDLVLSVDKSKITNDNVNDLGIREIIGVGESSFAGSPRNRRHNISVGAEALNGILLKPDEEFSLLETLGDINAESGYLPELVIKGDETIAEYGGGLCQIGTTAFRLAINGGVEVTQRRNHSYRVGYYEPAGTDATIYDPWPDFRFKNDTGNYLLIQTRIEGDNIIFEFWGTSDGREVEVGDPAVYNIVRPGEAKEIFTDKLDAGERRRLEYAHNGADAHFERTITWPEEMEREAVEEVWTSHYIPWREVWLVGKVASSTEEVIEE